MYLKINYDPSEKLKPFIQYLRIIHVTLKKKKKQSLFIYITPVLRKYITAEQMAYVPICVRMAYGYPFFLKIVVLADCPKLNKRPDAGVFTEGSFSMTRLSQPTFFFACFFLSIANLLCKIALYSSSRFSSTYRLR